MIFVMSDVCDHQRLLQCDISYLCDISYKCEISY